MVPPPDPAKEQRVPKGSSAGGKERWAANSCTPSLPSVWELLSPGLLVHKGGDECRLILEVSPMALV